MPKYNPSQTGHAVSSALKYTPSDGHAVSYVFKYRTLGRKE
ncbi:MAG: hypothetical protein UHG68_07870 [Clostridia bacterium]|nr:hypothetical protein [Clostridia bacterium]